MRTNRPRLKIVYKVVHWVYMSIDDLIVKRFTRMWDLMVKHYKITFTVQALIFISLLVWGLIE
ncbi:hypothetical protein C4B60_10745 [Jeotgalibacillus proteolyticus]|uniref:Uncharacterized protein n=1 Tax=Jeotgalibacillus proteolyticus TaxID=2082395 RepID=A0A2S5GAL8_9BACL|nr:hypothetical protein C4B60_10745 [Jeotgalibacillus proteolyticus]